jgi:cell shape-determining protein MreC
VEKVYLPLGEPVPPVFELVGSNSGVIEENIYIDFGVVLSKVVNVAFNYSAAV